MDFAVFCIFASILLMKCLVETAPTPAQSTARSQDKEVKRVDGKAFELSFEKFFVKISEEMMENSEVEIQKIIKAENDLFKDFPTIFKKTDGNNDSTESGDGDKKSRKRRSYRFDTMMRSSYRNRLMARSRDVICLRRCYWKRMLYYCTYGIQMTEDCVC